MRAAMVGMMCVASIVAAAPKSADPIKAATNAMAEADFDKALALLDGALPKTTKPAEVAKLQMMRGEALVALQRLDEATQAFSAALAADPTAELAAASASPDAVNAMANARKLILSDLTVVISNGSKANVKLDNVEMGPAPLKTRAGAGTHQLEATGSSGEKVTREIVISPGKPLQITLEFPAPLALPPPPPTPPPAVASNEAPAAAVRTSSSGGSKIGFIPIGVGAVGLGVGIGCLVLASGNHQQLVDATAPRLDSANEARLVSDGSMFQTLGFAAIAVGAAAAAAGTAMLVFMGGNSSSNVHVTAAASPGGGYVGLIGGFEEVPR